jgi:iron(III) transport system substrate-binding protein
MRAAPAVKGKRALLMILPALVLTPLAACAAPAGTTDTPAGSQTQASGQTQCGGTATIKTIQDVAQQTGTQRDATLLDAAKKVNGGAINLYTEINEPGPLADGFKKKYPGLTVKLYRAGSTQIRQRVLEESAAQRSGADLIEMDGLEMAILDENKLLAPASSPLRDQVVPAGQFADFTADRFSYIVPTWNTKRLAASDVPKSLEDLADSRFKGKLALEGSDVFWFAAQVSNMESEKGMTQAQAVDVFRNIAKNASITSGHTTTMELVVAGQYGINANGYIHRAAALKAKGAPIEWSPVNIPLVAEATTLGLPCLSANPAGALLLQDYILSADGGQQIFVQQERTPSNAKLAAQQVGATTVQPIKVDLAKISKDFQTWSDLWDSVVRGGGK